MAIYSNAFPLSINGNQEINACLIPYQLDFRSLESLHPSNLFRRHGGDKVACFSSTDDFPLEGEVIPLSLSENLNITSFLFKKSVIAFLESTKRNIPTGFKPIEIVSSRPEDNLISPFAPHDFPFSVLSKYELDTRTINGKVHLIIDSSTRIVANKTLDWFITKGFPLTGRFVVSQNADGYRRLLGKIESTNEFETSIVKRDGNIEKVSSSKLLLDATVENYNAYSKFALGKEAKSFIDKTRIAIGKFSGGVNKRDRINKMKKYLDGKLTLISGQTVTISDSLDLSKSCNSISKPYFIFNDNFEANWHEKGLTQSGPYTKRTFDRNNPSICVICLESHKGQIEAFIWKFLKGIPNHKYFSSGLEGKFHIGTSKVEFFTFAEDGISSYKNAIERALAKAQQDGKPWGLALVQVKQSHKELSVTESPYYLARSIFLTHQIPIQDFTLELLNQTDSSLGYSLNNMALACYAKMGGVPWLLKSSPTISHELVIGIGSANLTIDKLDKSERVMGITTVFSGDGSYIVSNTSKAVSPSEYSKELINVLNSTIEKISKKLNWQKDDTIRIVFHASVKKFNTDEIEAVKAVVENYKSFNIEYAFLKISEKHTLHLFDNSTINEEKGKLAPKRGLVYPLSPYENLAYLIGQNELKQISDGHPHGVIINIHKDSTFKDLKYLTNQLFNFSAHSWRSYFPSPMPVTIIYSDLIAHHLGWLNKLQHWNDTIMLSKIGQTQWFL